MRRRDLAAVLALGALAASLATTRASHAQGAGEPAPANPHGGGGAQMFEPPPDTNEEDARLATGSIDVTILDADNHAMAGVPVTLGILHQSVAKGESREHKAGVTDPAGIASFRGLETGSGIAYRVSVVKDGGTFWAMPFVLPQDKGERVQLHVYPVTHDIDKALVVTQGALYAEVKDDRIQLEEAVTLYNLGRTAWVPNEVVLTLPADFTAFSAQQSMSDQGVDAVEKQGAKLRGTFGPGQHTIDFRWQLPYAEERDVTIEAGMPPHLAVARALAAASQDVKLVVSGFPEAVPQQGNQGERILVTERQMQRNDPPLTKLHVELRDLPVPGPARRVATALAALVALGGLAYAFASRQAPPSDADTGKDVRARLLAELEELERAHRAGDVGPKTYERARRELIDAIARTLVAA
jgi:hypothetical protein